MNIVNDPLVNKIAEKILENREFREECKKEYTIDNLCLHWYEIFNSLDTITNEE